MTKTIFRHFFNHVRDQVKYPSRMNPLELIFMINKGIMKG